MNRATLEERYKSLRNNPEYKRDWERLQMASGDEWNRIQQEMKKKYGVKKFPNPNYDPQKRTKKENRPPNHVPTKHISLEDYERVRIEGTRDNDPLELKKYAAERQEYRQERERWEIPLSPETLSRLWELAEAGDQEGYENLRDEIIDTWAKDKSELVAQMLEPCARRRKFLEMMARPLERGGFGLSFPEKYPFGIYSPTVNILVRRYGTRPDVMRVILDQISPAHPKMLGKGNLADRELEHIFGQEKSYRAVVEHLANSSARPIQNLEYYLHPSLRNHYWETKRDRKRTVSLHEPSTVVNEEEENEETTLGDDLYAKSFFVENPAGMAKRALSLRI